jgi:ferredoxin
VKRLRFRPSLTSIPVVVPQIPAQTVARQDDLAAWLRLLFPDQGHRWEKVRVPKAIRVCQVEPSPPFPPVKALLTSVLRDAEAAAEEVRQQFGLRAVDVVDAPVPRAPDSLLLDAEQFCRLHAAVTTGEVRQGVFLAILQGPGRACCIRAREGAVLSEAFSAAQAAGALPEAGTGMVVRRLLTGEEVNARETPVDRTVSLLAVTPADRAIRPGGGSLFPFPAFNRKLGERKARPAMAAAVPCTNCLACAAYCPSRLYPSLLLHLLRRGSRDDADRLRLGDCVECGLCTFVCPSRIPLAAELGKAASAAP